MFSFIQILAPVLNLFSFGSFLNVGGNMFIKVAALWRNPSFAIDNVRFLVRMVPMDPLIFLSIFRIFNLSAKYVGFPLFKILYVIVRVWRAIICCIDRESDFSNSSAVGVLYSDSVSIRLGLGFC